MPISATPETLFSVGRTYRVLKKLAESTNSIVYLAAATPTDNSTHSAKSQSNDEQLVVLKKLPRTLAAYYELEIHQYVHAHPNILPLLDAIITEDAIYLVLEYCPAGDLFDAILTVYNDKTLTQRQRERWAIQKFRELVHAVHWCHQLGIWHRDIKPENILLASDGRVQLTDFGLATEQAQTEQRGKGSLFYMAPELFASPSEPFGSQPVDSTRTDIWALGILLLNMLGGRNPWPRATYDDEAFQIYLSCPHELRVAFDLSDDAWLVLKQMLSVDPELRPNTKSVLAWVDLVDQWVVQKDTPCVAVSVPLAIEETKVVTRVNPDSNHPYPINNGNQRKVIPDSATIPAAVTRSASLSSLNSEVRSPWIAEPTMTRSVSQASTPSYTFSDDSTSDSDEEEDMLVTVTAAMSVGAGMSESLGLNVDTCLAVQLPEHPTKAHQNHDPLHAASLASAHLAASTTIRCTLAQSKPTQSATVTTGTMTFENLTDNKVLTSGVICASHPSTQDSSVPHTSLGEDDRNDTGGAFSWLWNMMDRNGIRSSSGHTDTPICT